jgi:plastocyanin
MEESVMKTRTIISLATGTFLATLLAAGLAGRGQASSGGSFTGTVTATPPKFTSNVVVYLQDAPKTSAAMSATIDNKGMMFEPHITVIAAGGTVKFTNSDSVPHNVFSPDNDKFDLGTVAPGGSATRTFSNPGVYSLLCNIHPDMLGYLVVIPSSYYSVTGADGKFSIAGVPDGTYTAVAWSEKLPQATQKVTVSGGAATGSFDLHR